MEGPVLVTGALGFIGRALTERLLAAGLEVRGVDVRADRKRRVVVGDVAVPGDWQRQAEGCDTVIHTAAIVSNAKGLAEQWRVNVLGTRRALDAARDGGAKRFVQISSVRAFSDLDFPDGVDESWPVRPDGAPYVDTKVASEQVALQAHAAGEIEVTVIRPGDVYGPRSRPWTILPVDLIKARQFLLPAMGRGIFSPVYVENLVDGILTAAAAEASAGEVFTLSDGVGVTCRQFFGNYYRMLARHGPPVAPTGVAMAVTLAAGLVERARGRETELQASSVRYLARRGTYSIEKARRVLGYEPAVSLAEGMERTEEWLRAEGYL